LPLWSKKALKSLLIPGGVFLVAVAVIAHTGWVTLAPPALTFLYYCAFVGGMLLAWRFHSSRMALALLVLFLGGQTIALAGGARAVPGTAGWIALQATAVLLPVNFILISLMHERGFAIPSVAPMAMLLFVQTVIVTVLCRAAEGAPAALHGNHAHPSLPAYATIAFAAGGVFLLAHWSFTRKPLDAALLWSLASFFLSIDFLPTARISNTYATAAVFILAISIIETSYLLAYHDELTTLPSRRAFNDAMMALKDTYSIAVVDIDHFKRFNDTYGHDTGDQVLRLVASKLAHVTGGGHAYRCGGEEFTILFPGKRLDEVSSHLERLRMTIESAEFRRRGDDRRHIPRGPDRRNERAGARKRKGHAIRQLMQETSPQSLSVTVSIGVAECANGKSEPDIVLEAADKALYRAKENGRNRVEAAAGRRPRAKAAGIA
jgi:diguanylate cyclase (GGDEF)-like protein